MAKKVCIIGGGLAGSEAALQLAARGYTVDIIEARPRISTPVHKTNLFAELVCSNSFKSEKEDSAAGLLKQELKELGSYLIEIAYTHRVPAGGALAVNRDDFAHAVTQLLEQNPHVHIFRDEVCAIESDACISCHESIHLGPYDAFVIASGPLTTDTFASWLATQCGSSNLSFYDAAAPIVYASSLNKEKVFSQSRYEEGEGDYLNAPFTKDEYEHFIQELIAAKRVISKDFETKDLFQACQPIEEIARKGKDAPRYGPLKPVGLVDPTTGKRPWATLQLRAEDRYGQSYNLVGFQTNLSFPEQERVFRLIPGLEHAEFARYGVMHRNTFLDAPRLMAKNQICKALSDYTHSPVFLAGQISGTEGYCEAMRSGLQAALELVILLEQHPAEDLPHETVYGALIDYACDPEVHNYQPMHVNFGIMKPLDKPIRNKKERYAAYHKRAQNALVIYKTKLQHKGVL